MAVNVLETLSVTIMYIVNLLNSFTIIELSPSLYLTLGDVIEYGMVVTIVLWIIGGMVRHNGNSG